MPFVNTTGPLPVRVWIHVQETLLLHFVIILRVDLFNLEVVLYMNQTFFPFFLKLLLSLSIIGNDLSFQSRKLHPTLHIRLGLFGYFALRSLVNEDPNHLNYGFWDQKLALNWVNQNIGFFGGFTFPKIL